MSEELRFRIGYALLVLLAVMPLVVWLLASAPESTLVGALLIATPFVLLWTTRYFFRVDPLEQEIYDVEEEDEEGPF